MIYKSLKKLSSSSLLALLTLFSLQGCGYRSTLQSNALSSYHSISVPYIEGDNEGYITSQVIEALCSSGAWKYRTYQGELVLKVKILGTKVEDVGYDRSFNANNQVERWMVPNERLLSILAEVQVLDSSTHKVVFGPKAVSANVKFDFDPEYNEDNLVPFSLAQYNFVENAERSAKTPLNAKLAKNIVDALINDW